VTGAGRGIGRGIALGLAQSGVRVELLLNNAAVVWPLGPTQDVDPAALVAAIAINVIGPITLAQRVLPEMLAAGWGRIVNVSAAIAARPGMLAGLNTYAASKGALEAHTLNLAAELEGTGVTANVYRPGTVDTSMQAYIRDQPREQIGAPLHDRFTAMLRSGALITPRASADSMIARLAGPA
jgi:NAD(P)-dependent dehydrogenase (short-subunit alcohol dehydrogenase family)